MRSRGVAQPSDHGGHPAGPGRGGIGRGGVHLGQDQIDDESFQGGRLGLPGDFLIAGDGRVPAAKLGRHAYDQWSVDELLALAARAPRSTPEAGVTWGASGEDTAQKEMTTLPGTWPSSR
ncbi:hypothetical protein ACQP10_03265 [Streptosporangium sandarakinum]|uniref:hypothetical protein n=1 Tax=Streptosporangium sandarakinum TaxID=1260955 RepID=UPI003D92D0B1